MTIEAESSRRAVTRLSLPRALATVLRSLRADHAGGWPERCPVAPTWQHLLHAYGWDYGWWLDSVGHRRLGRLVRWACDRPLYRVRPRLNRGGPR